MLQTISQKIQHARIRLNCKLAVIQAQEVLDGQQDLTVTVPFVSTHWETASLFDHVFIGTLARVIQPRVCFEIGTSLGLVTTTIAANTGEGTEIHTLDLSEGSTDRLVFSGQTRKTKDPAALRTLDGLRFQQCARQRRFNVHRRIP